MEEGAGGVRAGGAHFGSLLAKSGHVAKCSQQDIFFMNSLPARRSVLPPPLPEPPQISQFYSFSKSVFIICAGGNQPYPHPSTHPLSPLVLNRPRAGRTAP